MLLKECPVDVADLALFEKVFAENRGRLLALAQWRLDPVLYAVLDPEDVLSEVYLRARERWAAFLGRHGQRDPAERPYYAWLRGQLLDCLYDNVQFNTRHCRDRRRHQGWPDRSSLLVNLGLWNSGPTPSDEAGREEQLDRVRRALNALKPAYRDLLLMLYAEGLSNVEAAEILGVAAGTLRLQRMRAVRKLRDKWIELFGPEGMPP